MKQQMKQWIKNKLAERQVRQYDRLLETKTVTYDAWIRDAERVWMRYETENTEKKAIRFVPYEACEDYIKGTALQSETAQVVVFSEENGEVSEIAEAVVSDFFAAHERVTLAYGDEDVMSPEGIRYTPWLKPDWSPDTFLSHFYFGNIFAVRMCALRALTAEEKQWIWKRDAGRMATARNGGADGIENANTVRNMGIYRLCYVLALKSGGFERRQGDVSVGHMDEVLFHSRMNRELEVEGSAALEVSGCPVRLDDLTVSVIIPSKDNAEVLKRCIASVQNTINAKMKAEPISASYEIIVVDNGSATSVKQELEDWLRQQGSNYYYIYQPMPFHFSKMCNLGAQMASGSVLLFLNDDVEIPEHGWQNAAVTSSGWQSSDASEKSEVSEQRAQKENSDFLGILCHAAKRPFTGAVGVKLYYPASRRIQHAGIVNLRLGPVHKLQFKEDDISYYYGWNRRRRNVIAVTGACLAVEKQKFEEVGGFSEQLPVAFNDVDLCFSLYERGYYNVVLQDIALFHHESLSRGNDDDRGKLNRLLGEKDKLYERHPGLYGTDPFYHKYLAGDMLSTGFELRADYDEKPQSVQENMQAKQGLLAQARQDACVMISLEYAGTEPNYFLQGYSFVIGSDNACFDKYVILRPDTQTDDAGETIWYVKAEPFIRKDVEDNLPDQVHVGMTGFCMELAQGALPAGSYRVGVMVQDKCAGWKIYNWTNRYLTVESCGWWKE